MTTLFAIPRMFQGVLPSRDAKAHPCSRARRKARVESCCSASSSGTEGFVHGGQSQQLPFSRSRPWNVYPGYLTKGSTQKKKQSTKRHKLLQQFQPFVQSIHSRIIRRRSSSVSPCQSLTHSTLAGALAVRQRVETWRPAVGVQACPAPTSPLLRVAGMLSFARSWCRSG